jgi:branched-chain amino acid transport system ATP-binding protein
MPLLEVTDLSVSFEGVHAVIEVSISVERGSLVGLIGPNGAGKTTVVDALTGFVPMTGQVWLDGKDLTSATASRRARSGLVRTWQSSELCEDLTVGENLCAAREWVSLRSFALDLVRPGRAMALSWLEEVLDRIGVAGLSHLFPEQLSHGQRKLVDIARALATDPKVILMDEPAAGLDTEESRALGERLRCIVEGGPAVLLIDHDMSLVLSACDYIYVMDFGRLIAAGRPGEIRTDPRVVGAYLGHEY